MYKIFPTRKSEITQSLLTIIIELTDSVYACIKCTFNTYILQKEGMKLIKNLHRIPKEPEREKEKELFARKSKAQYLRTLNPTDRWQREVQKIFANGKY